MAHCFSFPLSRPHCGIPLANGNNGVLVWGEKSLRFTVNRSDFWYHRNGCNIPAEVSYQQVLTWIEEVGCGKALGEKFRKFPWPSSVPHRIPAGNFELTFVSGVVPQRADFDLDSGTLTVILSNRNILVIDLLWQSGICRIADESGSVDSFLCHPSWEYPASRAMLESCGYPAPEIFPDGWSIAPPGEDKKLYCRIVRRNSEWFIWAGYEEIPVLPDESAVEISCDQWRKFRKNLPEIVSGDKFWDDFYKLHVHKLLSATLPGGWVAGLQGPWVEEYQPCPWSGDLHFNLNVQMIYGALLRIGKYECMLPLFDRIESPEFQENLRMNAKNLFGIEDGWYFTHAVDDSGAQCGGISAGACIDPACGGWTMLLYYDYWRYTGDMEFLAQRAYPAVQKVMRCFVKMLDENFQIPFAISAEYGASNPLGDQGGRNPSYQLAMIRKLAEILIEMAAALGEVPEKVWQDIPEKMPMWSVVDGFDRFRNRMEKRIAVWEGQDLENCHRHHSHLGCVWPFETFPAEPDEETAVLLNNTIDRWICAGMGDWSEWAFLWAVILDARFGFSGAAQMHLELFRKIFVNEGLCPVYTPRERGITMHSRHNIALDRAEKEVMQLDGSAGFISAYTDLFVHQHGEIVELLKAVPEQWCKTFKVNNVPLRGGWKISVTPESFTLSGGKSGAVIPVRIAGGKIKNYSNGTWPLK